MNPMNEVIISKATINIGVGEADSTFEGGESAGAQLDLSHFSIGSSGTGDGQHGVCHESVVGLAAAEKLTGFVDNNVDNLGSIVLIAEVAACEDQSTVNGEGKLFTGRSETEEVAVAQGCTVEIEDHILTNGHIGSDQSTEHGFRVDIHSHGHGTFGVCILEADSVSGEGSSSGHCSIVEPCAGDVGLDADDSILSHFCESIGEIAEGVVAVDVVGTNEISGDGTSPAGVDMDRGSSGGEVNVTVGSIGKTEACSVDQLDIGESSVLSQVNNLDVGLTGGESEVFGINGDGTGSSQGLGTHEAVGRDGDGAVVGENSLVVDVHGAVFQNKCTVSTNAGYCPTFSGLMVDVAAVGNNLTTGDIESHPTGQTGVVKSDNGVCVVD